MNLLFMKSLWSKIFVEKKFRFSSTKQSLDVKIDTFEWTFYSWSHYGQRLSLKKEFRISSTKQSSDSNLFMKSLWSKTFVEKKVWILLYLAIIGRKKRHFWMNPLLSGKKVALGVPFEYDNFTNFFSNSHIWHFSRFILSCDMKLDLSISVILRREKCYK